MYPKLTVKSERAYQDDVIKIIKNYAIAAAATKQDGYVSAKITGLENQKVAGVFKKMREDLDSAGGGEAMLSEIGNDCPYDGIRLEITLGGKKPEEIKSVIDKYLEYMASKGIEKTPVGHVVENGREYVLTYAKTGVMEKMENDLREAGWDGEFKTHISF
jgi:hypothetical protein